MIARDRASSSKFMREERTTSSACICDRAGELREEEVEDRVRKAATSLEIRALVVLEKMIIEQGWDKILYSDSSNLNFLVKK